MPTKKPAKKTTAAKKPVAKTKVAAKAPVTKSAPAIKTRFTKTQIVTEIAEKAELNKKQVTTVLDELTTLIERHVKKNSAGEFVLPGLFKVKTIKKKATKARKGINPFTGEEAVFQAKPARTVVKVLPLKGLKDMAG